LHLTHLGFSPAVYGAVISMNGALIVFCELPLTRLTQKFPARRTMAAGHLLCATGYALNAFAHSIPTLVLCMIVFTFGEMILMPTAAAYLANLAPPEMRGRYMGVSGLTWSMALIIGSVCGLKLFATAPAAYWTICASMGVFGALVIGRPLGSSKPQAPNFKLQP
jgi:MFS family permease